MVLYLTHDRRIGPEVVSFYVIWPFYLIFKGRLTVVKKILNRFLPKCSYSPANLTWAKGSLMSHLKIFTCLKVRIFCSLGKKFRPDRHGLKPKKCSKFELKRDEFHFQVLGPANKKPTAEKVQSGSVTISKNIGR
jgi:hypothetical protein